MNEYLIAELLNSVNPVLYNPIQLTQRIKYVSYDVSVQYIVLGANSGGLYVFRRYPCSFIKLIPSTEGSVVYICISPDEKLFAFGTSKGIICLVDNNTNKFHRDIQIYNEHQGNQITAMIWNKSGTELYTGDNTGKLSVLIPQSFITKTMFQIPCSTLMQLDTCVVQIDMCSQFLIVSTLTRCYLCDTEKEQYRQIGQKLRDGDFGACFYGIQTISPEFNEKSISFSKFRILSDKEPFMSYDGLENLKMFCARPGSRLWEVKMDGTVIRTHQFKHALLTKNCNIIQLSEDCDSRLTLSESTSPVKAQSLNFKKLFVLKSRFIITFKKDGLYIFDPQNASVIFWTDSYKDISDIKIVKNFIYLWTLKKEMHVLLFSNLEDFLTKCLLSQKYLLCADLCVKYEDQILSQITSSRKLHLLSTLDEKLIEKGEMELNASLSQLICKIKEYTEERQNAQKLNSGIYVVDNAHYLNNSLDDNSQNVTIMSQNDNNCSSVSNENEIKSIMNDHYEMKKANKLFSSKTLTYTLDKYATFDEICLIFQDFETSIDGTDTDKRKWCYDTILYYLNTKEFHKEILNSESEEYVVKSFKQLNDTKKSCKCGFPLPSASQIIPKYYNIGSGIMDRKQNDIFCKSFCKEVPYMWKYYLKLYGDEDIRTSLPIIVQYNDIATFRSFADKFTYDLWNDVLKLFVSLNNGNCLNCEEQINEKSENITWSTLSKEMIKHIGAESTVGFLLECDDVPPNTLDKEFYQAAIFSSIIDNYKTNLRKTSIDLVQKIYEAGHHVMFGNLLDKFLQNKEQGSPIKVSHSNKRDDCSVCEMPLQTTPVLTKEKLVTLDCGHSYHTICLNIVKNICNICPSENETRV